MGVHINMEMPKDGAKLYMIVFSDGKACASYKPFEWHEVVSLPPHGRLIDADALMLRVDMHGTNKFGMLDDDIREFINAAPTIIPKSGGTEDE